jgi:hypothetical protein
MITPFAQFVGTQGFELTLATRGDDGREGVRANGSAAS